MSYANAKQIPFVVLAGESEMQAGQVTLKNMETGEQQMLTPEELLQSLIG
jgi:histidyl-tRNA synthetase